MKRIINICFFILFCLALNISAQIPVATLIQISKAEDELRFDKTLEDLMKNADAKIRTRAALAAGRIGDEKAIASLTNLLEKDSSAEVRAMAAFALGEIESIKAADAIIKALKTQNIVDSIRARAVEAAGKIAAANAKDEKAKALSEAISDVLETEERRAKQQNRETVLLGLTAVLRAKPEEAGFIVAKFLTNLDARVRADAANTLTRMRAKNANEALRSMLLSDSDPIARANAARALGAAEDKESFDILQETAATDDDSRVRVSAIRSLGSLKDAKAAGKLLERGEKLLSDYKKSKFANPVEKSELLEIASTLGRIMPNSNDERAVKFLDNFRQADKFRSPETEIAFAQVAPKIYVNSATFNAPRDTGFGLGFYNAAGAAYYADQYAQGLGAFAQGLGEIANNKAADNETVEKAREKIKYLSAAIPVAVVLLNPEALLKLDKDSAKDVSSEQRLKLKEESRNFNVLKRHLINGFPEVLRAMSKLKTQNYEKEIAGFLLNKPVVVGTAQDGTKTAFVFDETESEKKEAPYQLLHRDPIVRATAAELVGEIEDVRFTPALRSAYEYSVAEDTEINDAQLAILDALEKQYKNLQKKGAPTSPVLQQFKVALESPDYLVRRKAISFLKSNGLAGEIPASFEAVNFPSATDKSGAPNKFKTVRADYVRAVSRQNGSVKAVLTTEKGNFTIDLTPEDAPLTVDNFIRLAKSNYFNGLTVHRVVPNFVMQDGDPRGDGNGGPGWQIRCEINMLPYERGAVGMALSGKDTGGSQWFVTHSPQPHLDGGYTVFGRVNETDMKIVDSIVRGDKILKVRIIENAANKPITNDKQNMKRKP
ncbi:MAG TPA: peptidylprolyl isomerase [Pyrinomonadaceae bacterium]|jgi:cyclophilin family peptidyl-prolyl cis-trans isomerase/HEAT repeat protein